MAEVRPGSEPSGGGSLGRSGGEVDGSPGSPDRTGAGGGRTATGSDMKISRLSLKNFKCFEFREFSFGSRFNLIIGDNATGKTTLLDGLAVGVGSLFLGMPEPAAPRNLHRNEVRLPFYRHGDMWT